LADIENTEYKVDDNVSLSIYNGKISINVSGLNKLAFVDYNDTLFEMIKKARFRIPEGEEEKKAYKYLYSNEYKKALHQIVFDYYFGEDVRKKAYESGYIIEHLDNDGYNCQISNLFILKKIKNTYKGWHFDKLVSESLPVISLKIYHVIENKTFQVVIFFNQTFIGKNDKEDLESIKLLYEYNYDIVLQDAEQILESILESRSINLKEWSKLYRYKDIRIRHRPTIELSEEEKSQGGGTLIWRDGVAYLLIGSVNGSSGFVESIGKDEAWDMK